MTVHRDRLRGAAALALGRSSGTILSDISSQLIQPAEVQ